MKNNHYTPHDWINCIDSYIKPEGEWDKCPKCNLTPRVWIFDNGRSTACGCWENMYEQFSIHAESVMSVYKRTGGLHMDKYDPDELRKNWNHYCSTGEINFVQASERDDGRW